MLHLEPHPDGVDPARASTCRRPPQRTQGHSRGSTAGDGHPGPEKGKANKAILELLADKLGLRKNQLELLSGETSSQKKFLVREITAEDLNQRISDQLGNH